MYLTYAIPITELGWTVLDGGAVGTCSRVRETIKSIILILIITLHSLGVTSWQKNGSSPARRSGLEKVTRHSNCLLSGGVVRRPPSCPGKYNFFSPSPCRLLMISSRCWSVPRLAESIHPRFLEAHRCSGGGLGLLKNINSKYTPSPKTTRALEVNPSVCEPPGRTLYLCAHECYPIECR